MDERVHGGVARRAEHRIKTGGEDAIVADGLEHVYLVREDPVAAVAQHPAKPFIDVVSNRREGEIREQHERA